MKRKNCNSVWRLCIRWALYFTEKQKGTVTLIHRSESFRAHNDSVQKAIDYSEKGWMKMILNAEVKKVEKEMKNYIYSVKTNQMKILY